MLRTNGRLDPAALPVEVGTGLASEKSSPWLGGYGHVPQTYMRTRASPLRGVHAHTTVELLVPLSSHVLLTRKSHLAPARAALRAPRRRSSAVASRWSL